MLDVVVVMPVYNEEAIIAHVVRGWVDMLNNLGIAYELRVYNDGSKDHTAAILDGLAPQCSMLRVFHKNNTGHGPTLMAGYLDAARDARWVFQTDSDNEIAAELFPSFWARRDDRDLLIAARQGRLFSWPRRVVTGVSFLTVRLFFGKGVYDVNAPYRLMRAPVLLNFLLRLPPYLLVPNVVLSGLFCRRGIGIAEIPVAYHHRQTGVVSIQHWKLLRLAMTAFLQTVTLAVRTR